MRLLHGWGTTYLSHLADVVRVNLHGRGALCKLGRCLGSIPSARVEHDLGRGHSGASRLGGLARGHHDVIVLPLTKEHLVDIYTPVVRGS